MNSIASQPAYLAVRAGVGLIGRDDEARLVVSGADRATYLHGLLTNDITALQAGQGCYAAYLTAQGRMIADLHVYELGDVILLTVLADVKDTVLAKLNQFIFSEDVQLGDVTATFGAVAVAGPRAALSVARALDLDADTLSALPEHGNVRASFDGHPAIVLRVGDLGEPGLEVLVETAALASLRARLHTAGAVDIDDETAEVLRVEGGVPRFRRDMDEETIPLEAGIESRAISLTKGCYVGQEVIIRVLHRGHGRVAKKLVGLTLGDGPVPARRAVVHGPEKAVGEVTSAVWSLALDRPIALAYVQRDFVAPGTTLTVDGHAATVTALPFRLSQS